MAIRRCWTASNCCPTPPALARSSRRASGYISAIDAEDIGLASTMIGAGRDTKEDVIDPAVGVILEVKVGQKIDAGSVLCRIYYTTRRAAWKKPPKWWKTPSAFRPAAAG